MSSRLRAIAKETVTIAAEVAAAVAGTRLYLPDDALPAPSTVDIPATVEVTNESGLSAAHRLGTGVACLVFASARNPGGGFVNGAQAQEERIARLPGRVRRSTLIRDATGSGNGL